MDCPGEDTNFWHLPSPGSCEMNQSVPRLQIILELQISSPHFISCPGQKQGWSPAPAVRALLEQWEFPGNTLREPNNHSRNFKTEKKPKMLPISHLASTTHLRGYTLPLPVVFPSITIYLLNWFAGNIPTVQPLKSSKKGLSVTALLCFENNEDAQYCFSLNSS